VQEISTSILETAAPAILSMQIFRKVVPPSNAKMIGLLATIHGFRALAKWTDQGILAF